MDNDTLRTILLVVLGAGAALSFVLGFLFPIRGQFVREDDGSDEEALVLTTLGPFVRGRVEVQGGHREYSGLALFGKGSLVRRDHGVRALVDQGYPQAIAEKRDGEVAARLKVVRDGGDHLEVMFSAARVEFTHQPPRVTDVVFIKPQRRRYRRAD